MNVVLSKRELEKLKHELGVESDSNADVARKIVSKIPKEYRQLVKFQTLPSGTLCINIDDRVTLSLYNEFNPHEYSVKVEDIVDEVNHNKSKLFKTMPMLAFTLATMKKKFIDCLDNIVSK